MKKYFKYAFLSAIALTGAVSFTACSSSDDVAEDLNPTYNPKDNTVKTQFALSLSNGGAKNGTRMAAATVQNEQSHTAFRGMSNIKLIPFSAAPAASSSALGPIIGPLTMNKSTTTPSSTESSYNNATNDAVVYTNITVPTNTTHFLFYGNATPGSGTNFDNGALTVAGLTSFTTPSAITFTPVEIYDANKTTEIAVGTNLIALLNSLLTTTDGETTPKKWSEYTDHALLNDLYTKYITLKTASSTSVEAMLIDLYTSLEGISTTSDGTAGKTMAVKLREAISAGFNTSVGTGNIKYAGYPGNLGMPDGAALLTFNTTNGFSLASTNAGNYPAGTISVTSYSDYVYPADLQYYANSDIVVSNEQQSSNFSTLAAWSNCLALYKNGTSVTAATKSIALNNEIQYGVGNLYTVVNPLSSTTYYDRVGDAIDLTAATPFTLTGVLVGSQGAVDWQFLPPTTGTKTIYDNVINSASLTTTAAANNYTLGLQTVDATGDGSTGIVYIALELQNNTGKAFMGKDGLIPAGGKFYLAGKLDPKSTTEVTGSGSNSVFKQDYKTTANITISAGTGKDANGDGTPDDNDGDGKPDEYTGGFAEATNAIPDLRTPQSEVCFSVNLVWETGITFNKTF